MKKKNYLQAVVAAAAMVILLLYARSIPSAVQVQETMEIISNIEGEESMLNAELSGGAISKPASAGAAAPETAPSETKPSETAPPETGAPETASLETVSETEILHFLDAFKEEYEVAINPDIAKHGYDMAAFSHDGDRLSYEGDETFTYRLGVDVSHHNGEIDWEKVKEQGFDFAFIRLGYRGYGEEGNIRLDREFSKNIQNAQAAGIDVGIYFYAQAVNEKEALEEADFVLENLQEYTLELPVVYDPESVLEEEARTDNVTGEQFTKNTRAFCKAVEEAGYQPMIYCNMLWQAYELDLTELAEYPVWYADYEELPQTPYQFEFWQYTNTAQVDGIGGPVDLDIQLLKK